MRWRSRLASSLGVALALWCTSLAHAWADKRVALVIGNGAYANAPRLPNPAHDADDVAAALKNINFEVIRGIDLDQASMQDAVIRFARASASADVGIFYYSGHAMQFNGVNYLMPVDAKLEDEADLYRFTKVDDVLGYLQQVKALKILVLDSCRDNPLTETLKRSINATRAVSIQRGLAAMQAPTGMIVSYATQAGRTAADGMGRNSPYTAAFLRHIEEPAEIGDIFRDITADVFQVTGEKQLPELSLSIIGKLYLKDPVFVTVNVPPRPTPADPCAAAGDHWRSAESIGTLAAFEDHLARFSTCAFAGLAKARIDALRRQAAVAVPTAAVAAPAMPQGLGGAKPATAAKPQQPVIPCGSTGAESVSLSSPSLRAHKPLTRGEECGLKPKEVFRECDNCPEMVVLPAGSFIMGAADAKALEYELPRHEVTLAKPFSVGKIHVTRAQFMTFVGETGYSVGPCFPRDLDLNSSNSGDHPVVCVNFADATAYIDWLSTKTGQPYRLLTESEFEYADRAGTVTEWFWGDKAADAKAYAHCWDCSGNGFAKVTAPAGSLKPNAFGLYDMSGNAYQMVQDCHKPNYNGAPADGSARSGEPCTLHVIRGGSWEKTAAWGRSASRFLQSADKRSNEVGFRVARTLR
jgi:formylglycine-generating enzyme required for sulfatase activity